MGPSTVRRRASRNLLATQGKRPIVSLVRGTVQMHRARITSAGMPLVHTTDLSNGQLRPELRKTSVPGRSCCGPVVLVPRVGRPMLSKVVRLSLRSDMMLSDCVIALECDSEDDSVKVQRVIEERWDEFEDSYGGSCAPYISLKALQNVLDCLGFQSEVRRESRGSAGFGSTSPIKVRESPDSPRTGTGSAVPSGVPLAPRQRPGVKCGEILGHVACRRSAAELLLERHLPQRERVRPGCAGLGGPDAATCIHRLTA